MIFKSTKMRGLGSWINRFSERAGDYSKYRPAYPPDVIETIISGAVSPSLCVADIGAGTGISANAFSSRGIRVIAIEPNRDMLETGRALFPCVNFRYGTAEHTGLFSSSVGIVSCFQAFHWVDQDRALKEFYRITRPHGRVALAWNIRDDTDEFTREYGKLVYAYGNIDLRQMLSKKEESGNLLLQSPLFINGIERSFAFSQVIDESGLVGRIRSVSSLPNTGAAFEQLIAEARNLRARFARFDGTVTLKYRTVLFLAEVLK